MTIFNFFIKFILIFLIVFTPIAFGSIELWAFSIMELGILLIIILWAVQSLILQPPHSEKNKGSFRSHVPISIDIFSDADTSEVKTKPQ